MVTKRRVDAFATTDLETVLKARDVTTLVLLGIATSGVVLSTVRWAADADYDMVVLSTVRWAADADYDMVVVADCCADADEEVHRLLIEKVFPRQATVVDSADLLRALGSS